MHPTQIQAHVYRSLSRALTHTGRAEPALRRVARSVRSRLGRGDTVVNPVRVDGFTLYHRENSPEWARMWAEGTYEPATVATLRRLLHPGMTMLDVGANIGYLSLIAARSVGPRGHVYAFEPDPYNRVVLERNMRANAADCVEVVPMAVGRASGPLDLHVNTDETGVLSTLYAGATAARGGTWKTVRVETKTLDVWAAARGWPPIHVVKLDIEGAELDALAGAGEVLRRNPEVALIVEMALASLAGIGVTTEEFLRALRAADFGDIRAIEGQYPEPIADAAILESLAKSCVGETINLLCRRA